VSLEPGARLGSYEIVAPLGAGGMGEVYRARDARIGRDVAIKVLPQSLSEDRDRLARFQREARSAGSLNHPNLLTVHEFGAGEAGPYIVSELLEGSTLRERLAGSPLPQRKAIDYALQMAHGLAAAHESGIVHRDLKPENIFITRDGRVKILDFGLAKVRGAPRDGATDAETEARDTEPGTVLGTAGYMSPEQVRGGAVDHRTDIFSLGAILYEMLSGQRAFRGSSSIDTMHAILHDEPPELSEAGTAINPALERIVQHCLEKNPEERFQSARDLAFDLEMISGTSDRAPAVSAPGERKRRRATLAAAVAVALVAAAATGWLVAWRMSHRPPPQFHRLTFRSSTILGARFVPGQSSAVFDVAGNGTQLFTTALSHPEMRPVGVQDALLLGVSRSGELAILVKWRFIGGFTNLGTLARVALGGGAPREVADNVQFADWTPAGDDLLVARSLSDHATIEFPIGTVVYSTSGWIGSPRFSPDGKSIAFIEHPVIGDDGGVIAVLGPDRKKRVLTGSFHSAQGLTWSPRGDEIFFTAAPTGNSRGLRAVTLSGRERLVVSAPGILTVHDAAPDGRLLVAQGVQRLVLLARTRGDTADRDFSWLDWTLLRDISPDGKSLLFEEAGEGGDYEVYVRGIDDRAPVRLGTGSAGRVSPDGRTVLLIRPPIGLNQLFACPLGSGETRPITAAAMTIQNAAWLPDGKRVLFIGYEPNQHNRVYIQDLAGGAPRPVSGERVGRSPLLVSPDGTRACVAAGGHVALMPLSGGPITPLPELAANERPIRFSADGKSLLFFRLGQQRPVVQKIDLATHRIEPMMEIPGPANPWGIITLGVSADLQTYAYNTFLDSSDLYLLEGVR
jgi:Tol biopolymer transport system component/tRNA A-37 threonylcarbamoyl transferase component Bud32